MRTIKSGQDWKRLITGGPGDPLDNISGYSQYYRNRQKFTRAGMFAIFLVECALFSFFFRQAFVLFLSLSVFLFLLRAKTRKTAEGIFLKRVVNSRCHEMDALPVKYVISNKSGFLLSQFLILDFFSGSKGGGLRLRPSDSLSPGDSTEEHLEVICDGGMGEHKFGPLEAVVTDPLGLFEFRITEDESASVYIFPKIQNLPELRLSGSRESLLYGIYEVNGRGGSSNFMGIREYVPGDPIKQISWKLTAKHSRLLVKEFEKITNSEISILLDMDGRYHAGLQAESTWEYARDATLCLVSQQTGLGNTVQLLSQTGYIPWGKGADHCHYITRCMPDFVPQAVQRDLVSTYWEMIPRSSTVFYVGAVFPGEYSETLKNLAKLKFKDVDVYCILFDGNSFMQNKFFGVLLNMLVYSTERRSESVNQVVRSLRLSGIQTILVRHKENVGQSLLKLEAS